MKKVLIAIAAGKGGVGKSTVAVNLALALKQKGYKVGLLDADIYGPSIRQMLPEEKLPEKRGEKITPAEAFGLKIISMAFFGQSGQAAAVRAPVANGFIEQFLSDVEWGELDFLLIDFPPGTGDIQLTLAQKSYLAGALIVTTPQEVALIDVRKAIQLFERVSVPVLGVVENMSYFLPPGSNEKLYLFGKEGGVSLAQEMGVPLLGQIPIDPEMGRCADQGRSLFDQDSCGREAFEQLSSAFLRVLPSLEIEMPTYCQEEGARLTISWPDRHPSEVLLSDLQTLCPCTRCREEKRVGEKGVVAHKIDIVGRYAFKFAFSSGCSKGIYPFALIKALT